MGCDIHGYIEYGHIGGGTQKNYFAAVRLARDYIAFGWLAGVRYKPNGDFIKPRGLPPALSWWVENAYCLRIDDSLADADGYCSQEEADRWVASGDSIQYGAKQITGPDWHSTSWLSYEEVCNAMMEYQNDCTNRGLRWDPSYVALVAAMDALPDARFVFWFDN